MINKQFDNDDFFGLVETELEDCGSVRFKVKGTSMQPIIHNGRDFVLLEKYDGQKLMHGDICLFRYRGRHVLHRYISDEEGFMVMQGDNVITSCEYCKKENIVGIVRTIEHNGQEVKPKSQKWHFITIVHRCYMRFRMFVGKVLRATGLR